MSQAGFWAVVPAAGIGSRMRSDVPKQYLTIAGEAVLARTLTRLLALDGLDAIVVALSAADRWWSELSVSSDSRIETVAGGAERADSVLAGLKALAGRAAPDDWVMVHDAARPCVLPTHIESMRQRLANHNVGGLMAIPVADTLKRGDASRNVVATVDRTGLWSAQTPQLFRYQVLHDSLERALREGVVVTDEASAVEWAGFQPQLFPGSNRNLKITLPEDVELAAMILAGQSSQEKII